MNFYFFSLFVILCFGSWATAGEVYLRLRENSAGAASETKRKSNGEPNFSVINGLIQLASQARTWAQWLRRLLKALRKWCSSHPPEVKLGKCLASYFNIKIPGLRQHEKIARSNDSKNVLRREAPAECSRQRKAFGSVTWDFLEQIQGRFKEYRDVIFSNDLFACVWDYIWKRFWIWVDSAPDSRCQV